ncbi:MAG: hypothetical protein ACD_75C00105G0003 [uncultured bacterium]|nr:MAG: hypothetical protein ACD_75C00105G0003 [uncultured bacterium]
MHGCQQCSEPAELLFEYVQLGLLVDDDIVQGIDRLLLIGGFFL